MNTANVKWAQNKLWRQNSASEDENNGIEESETSDDEYLSDLTKLRPDMEENCVSKESLSLRKQQ